MANRQGQLGAGMCLLDEYWSAVHRNAGRARRGLLRSVAGPGLSNRMPPWKHPRNPRALRHWNLAQIVLEVTSLVISAETPQASGNVTGRSATHGDMLHAASPSVSLSLEAVGPVGLILTMPQSRCRNRRATWGELLNRRNGIWPRMAPSIVEAWVTRMP